MSGPSAAASRLRRARSPGRQDRLRMDDLLEFGDSSSSSSRRAARSRSVVRVVAGRARDARPPALLLVVAAVASDLVDRLATILSFEDVQRIATLALDRDPLRGRLGDRSAPLPSRRGADRRARRARHVRHGGAARGRGALRARPLVDRGRADRRRARADRSGGDVLGARRQGGARSLGHDPRRGVGLQRPRRHRPDDRDGRARDEDGGSFSIVRERVRARDGGRPRRRDRRRRRRSAGCIRTSPLPDRTLYPIAVVLAAGAIYGAAAVAHGSGFLAVFVAGILVGDLQYDGTARRPELQLRALRPGGAGRVRRPRPDDRPRVHRGRRASGGAGSCSPCSSAS